MPASKIIKDLKADKLTDAECPRLNAKLKELGDVMLKVEGRSERIPELKYSEMNTEAKQAYLTGFTHIYDYFVNYCKS